jgi:hypothetical protein
MAWAQYVLNEFIDNCLDAQDSRKDFHYSWILLLLSMVLYGGPLRVLNDLLGMDMDLNASLIPSVA